MRTHYDTIYLAPHLDDAALSCGGQIHQQTVMGNHVLIVTIMAGDPPENGVYSKFVQELHDRWELAVDAEAVRREEDIEACQILGADYVHWSIPDCVYRMNPMTNQPLYPTWEDVITAVHPAESSLIQELANQFTNLPAANRIVAPLGVGNHADHLVVQQAAEICFGPKLWYFEDYPYVQEDGALTAVIPANTLGWQSFTFPLQRDNIIAKANAIAAYKSQISTFFKDFQDLIQQLKNYCQKIGGERIWENQDIHV